MTYRTYKITSKTTNTNWIKFELDGYVNFENGNSQQRIDCVNRSPFNNWYAGDYLEIDIDRTKYYSSGKDFDDTSIVSKTSLAVAHGRTAAREIMRSVDSQAPGKAEMEYRIEHPDGSKSGYIYRRNY